VSTWIPVALIVGLLVALALAAAPADAATYRIDDSAALPRESTALLGWRSAVPSRNGDDTLQGNIGVARKRHKIRL